MKISKLQKDGRYIKILSNISYSDDKSLLLIRLSNSFLEAPSRIALGKYWSGPVAMKAKLDWCIYGSQ